ncbi:MAG TPA: xanthine dehydrogenase small subunit [Flavobacteriales bacterium]|nr:xanthine dehydrogenase small subunit [Flavobacteriales bacterium]
MRKINNSISFVLDGKVVKIDFISSNSLNPTTTVLNYLRSLSNHKGVKEGCAEGDCGACTVVLGEGRGGKITYKAVDSCLIFLPMVQGKQLITVENIGCIDDLHPVQQAMVDTDGSQCGYCTPGFIMALFELYKNHNNPSREVIDDALTGNLCRCTGYRSIVKAASISCAKNEKDSITRTEKNTLKLLKGIKKESIHIKIKTQEYFLPTTLEEAISLRAKHGKALLVGGATDLALRVTKNNELLSKIIDLGNIDALKSIRRTKSQLIIGSGASLEAIKMETQNLFPALYKMLAVFGSKQIRHLATLGGNLGSASPIGDMPPILIAYNASVILAGPKGKRNVAINDFVTGYRSTVLLENEIIKEVVIPISNRGALISSYKISKRKDLDISTVSAGYRLELNSNQTIYTAKLVYGGMAAMPKRARKTEAFLKGKPWNREVIEQAMGVMESDFVPISDARSGAAARMIMAKNLLLKFWTENRN